MTIYIYIYVIPFLLILQFVKIVINICNFLSVNKTTLLQIVIAFDYIES